MVNWLSFCHTPSQQSSRDYKNSCDVIMYHVKTTDHVTDDNTCVRRRHIQRYASTVYFVALLLTQWVLISQHAKFTYTKHNFDTHQSVTDMTAGVGTPWLYKKLWLGRVLTTGRSSITAFGTCLDWWLCLRLSAMFQRIFGFKIKLQFRVIMTYLLHMTCFELPYWI